MIQCVEPDVKTFSVSLLTTVAIMDGVIKSLVKGQMSEDDKHPPLVIGDETKDETEGVLCDIQALVGLTDVAICSLAVCTILTTFMTTLIQDQLRECRLWKTNSEQKTKLQ